MTPLERARLRFDCYLQAVQLVKPQPPDADGKWQPSKPLSLAEALVEAGKIEAFCMAGLE